MSSFRSPNARKILLNCSEFRGGPPRWLRLEHLAGEERLGDLGLFSFEKR